MGLLVFTNYRTMEGAAMESVYVRVQGTNVSFPKDDTTKVNINVGLSSFVSRDAAILGYRELFNSPVTRNVSLSLPATDTWNSLAYIYEKVKEELGKTFPHIEDVYEQGQIPLGMTQ